MEESISTRHTKTRVITIPNGCDVDLFGARELQGNSLRTTLPWLAQRPLLLYAGTLGLVNNVEYIVRMAEKLWELNPDVRVAIVGSGARENAVRRLAQDVGVLDRNLFMIKEVTKAEIVAFFGACNLALSTVLDVNALNANSANKVFDAFAAGRAVAINHDGWLADLLRSTGAGLVLPANDPATAALVVCDFLLNTDRIGAAETAASQLAQTDFNRDSLFRKFHQVLLEATSEHVSSRRRIAVT